MPRSRAHSTQVLDTEHLPVGLLGELRYTTVGACGPNCVTESAGTTRTGQPSTDLVGRVGQLGNHHQVVWSETEQRRQPGDEFLGADHRQNCLLGHAGDAVPAPQAATAEARSAAVPAVAG